VILDFVKDQCHLSSPLPQVVALAIAALWLWRRPASKGLRRYVIAVTLGYWLVTTSLGAYLLVGGLSHGMPRITNREQGRDAQVVVLLGGGAMTARVGALSGGVLTGSSLLRALEAARVVEIVGAPIVIASGGIPRPDRDVRPESEILRDMLVKVGVAPETIVEESQSTTTREQAQAVASLLRDRHIERLVLVTSQTHMRRSLAVFRAAGLDPVPSVAPLRSEMSMSPPPLVPNSESLSLSDDAVYEYAAMVYYWARGWIRSPWPSVQEPRSGSQ
jgi:uncharacterized SAM-binding protein YcdF (DUF218 family)